MKRFYKEVEYAETDLGWIVSLDGRPLKTQGGHPQAVPTRSLAEMLAAEWRDQGETIDPAAFRFRDMADYAIDVVAANPGEIAKKLLGYAETDTLCYRAEPEEPLFRRQQEVWEPIVARMEAREGVSLHRVSGILHRAQPEATRTRIAARLSSFDPFTLAALEQLTSLAASLCIGLESLEDDSDGELLWEAANLEENWQVELWGRDEEAMQTQARKKADFLDALAFAKAAQP